MCNEAVGRNGYTLEYVPEAMRKNPVEFFLVPDRFKTQKMCINALEVDPWHLNNIPDYFNTQKMCDKTVKDDSYFLQFVPDWFVTQQQIDVWYDDDDYCNDDEPIEWYEGHQTRKAQKAKLKEELLPIARHPNRVMGWFMSEDEKRWWK